MWHQKMNLHDDQICCGLNTAIKQTSTCKIYITMLEEECLLIKLINIFKIVIFQMNFYHNYTIIQKTK